MCWLTRGIGVRHHQRGLAAGCCCAMPDIADQPDHPLHLNVVCCVQIIVRRCGVDVKIVAVASQCCL